MKRTYVLTAIAALGLPLMAFGQATKDEQQTTTQEQTNESQTTAPAKGKKMRPAKNDQTASQTKSQEGTNVRGRTDTNTNVKGRAHVTGAENQPSSRSSTSVGTSQTNVNAGTSRTTTVNKDEFRTRHSEVFSLGRHPKEFFVQRYGANHFRMIGNSYFVFLDGCWVAVDVDGFTYTERVICAGDPDFVEISD